MLTIILVAASCVCIVMYRREKIAKARREAQAAQLNTYTMPSVKYSDNPRGTMQQESAPDGFDDEQAPFVTGGGGGGGSYRDGSRSDLSGVNVL